MNRPQSGAVLLVALVMLIVITLTGVTTAALIQDNNLVIQNFESRAALKSAALSGLQQALARGTIVSTGVVFTSPCSTARTVCIDSNGDEALVSGKDIEVTIGPLKCLLAPEQGLDDIDGFDSDQASCQGGVTGNDLSGAFLCRDATYEVEAVAIDPVTAGSVSVRQGIATTTSVLKLDQLCGGGAD